MGQMDDKGMLIRGFYSKLCIVLLSVINLGSIYNSQCNHQIIVIVTVVQFRITGTLEAIFKIIGCHRIPICPFRIIPDSKGPGKSVLTYLRRGCHAGNCRAIRRHFVKSFYGSGYHFHIIRHARYLRVHIRNC